MASIAPEQRHPSIYLLGDHLDAALAMGEAGISWLAKLAADGFESALVTDDGRAFSSTGLPAAV